MPPKSHFLRLPLETRLHVYSYLLPRQTVSHPLPGVGVSTSHRLPPSNLLNLSAQITDEVLDYFYSITTFKLIFSHAFNFFRVDPELKHLEQSPSLRSIRKVEIVFFCDVLLLRSYPSFGLGQFCTEIRRRANRACDVLLQAKQLRSVTISWIDTTLTGGWDEKVAILEPLRKLTRHPNNHIKFAIGEINSADDVDQNIFRDALRRIVGLDNDIDCKFDGATEKSSAMRLLAFDTRRDFFEWPSTDVGGT